MSDDEEKNAGSFSRLRQRLKSTGQEEPQKENRVSEPAPKGAGSLPDQELEGLMKRLQETRPPGTITAQTTVPPQGAVSYAPAEGVKSADAIPPPVPGPDSATSGGKTPPLSPSPYAAVRTRWSESRPARATQDTVIPGGEIPPVSPSPRAAIRTRWSEGHPGGAAMEEAVTEIDNLTGLILPKGATIELDEVKIHARTDAFGLAGTSFSSPEGNNAWTGDISSSSIQDMVIDTTESKAKQGGKFGKLNIFQAMKPRVTEYSQSIHGPLVDLKFPKRPGIEEIELYPVNEPYAYIRVIYDHSTHEYTYTVLEPQLSPAEEDLFLDIKERIFERLDVNTQDLITEFAQKTLNNVTDEIVADYSIHLSPVQREKILYSMKKEFLGNGMIDPIMHDKYIEDISCDGVNSHIFVYHARYESMRTNLVYSTAEELDSFVTKLAQRSGKYISISEPMLDATMSDGSRIQMTLGQEVTAHGSTYTIRKFRDEPISPTDLIEWSTFSPLSIAFLWLAVESGKSCIFAGGTASGKTTSLNAISLFIPPLAKIVTLEDTRELKLPHPNWIPSVTRASFDTGGKGEIDMYELLKAALRQRPEYLIVGEVRGREALTLFQAMSTGHITYSTMHADSVASIVHRLENPPLNVPRNMLSALDLVSVQVQARIGGQRIRRNKQIIEILDLDPRTNELITNEVFRWHPVTDEISYSGKSFILEEIMEERGWDENRMREELKMRQEVLEWMRIKKIRNYRDVSQMLISYYRDASAVMEKVRAELYEQL
jgi:archaeal flagellar protein FlaI